ncbi:hypothetical protein GCM10008956_08690 [Deinococcus arenae]|uniref:Uncharacterized protein n=1 Tax=Deinococcus arenae TaxID=1452751 RepID=A0A8H9GKC9_9DEIO|nr:hypothetical protein GCM10008956_08690 [Deinococcus arenae]
MQFHPERGDEEPAAEQQGAGDHGLAGPLALHPLAEQGAAGPQEEQRDAEDQADLKERPVAGRARLGAHVAAEQPGEGFVEHGIAVDLADAQVHGQRGGRHQPAAPAGPGDGLRTIQNAHCDLLSSVQLFDMEESRRRAPRRSSRVCRRLLI